MSNYTIMKCLSIFMHFCFNLALSPSVRTEGQSEDSLLECSCVYYQTFFHYFWFFTDVLFISLLLTSVMVQPTSHLAGLYISLDISKSHTSYWLKDCVWLKHVVKRVSDRDYIVGPIDRYKLIFFSFLMALLITLLLKFN